MIYCGQLLRADNFSQILERKTKQEDDSISLHLKLMTRIWTWKQILNSLSFGNCCFCAVRQFEKKRKIENLVDCPKKRKPVRASREKVLTQKIFLTDFFALANWILSLKLCEKKTKSSFSDKFARFEKLLEFCLFEKFRWNLGLTENSAGSDRKKIKKNKKEKRIFVKLRQFSMAYQLTEKHGFEKLLFIARN